MVNYRLEDLHVLVNVLREEGCNVLEKVDDSEYGTFAGVIDPEGNKVELWQPPAGQSPGQSVSDNDPFSVQPAQAVARHRSLKWPGNDATLPAVFQRKRWPPTSFTTPFPRAP